MMLSGTTICFVFNTILALNFDLNFEFSKRSKSSENKYRS